MTRDDVLVHLRREPFQSFRVVLRDGRGFDVTHPRLVLLQRKLMHIGKQAAGFNIPVADGVDLIEITDIAELQPISAAAAVTK